MQALPRTCLIGGGGFIGTALARQLTSNGRKVTIINRSQPKVIVPDAQYIIGDYGANDIIKPALAACNEVVLLAYNSVPKTSFDNPLADITANLPPVLTLLEMARHCALKKIVILSSGGTVYGRATKLPIPETAPTDPISPYGITKLAIEKYAGMYRDLYGLPITIVRPSNAYGEGQQPYKGQGFIATAIASIVENKEIVTFGSPGATRDYIHVSDVTTALEAILNQATCGACYNIGTGTGTSNQKVLALCVDLAAKVNVTPNIVVQPTRPFDVPENILDASALTRDTGWKPSISLEKGIQRTWNWFNEKNATHP